MRLMDDDLRVPLEAVVSDYLGQRWNVGTARDMLEFACHPCAILSNGQFAVFAKYGEGEATRVQFEIELDRLQFLRRVANVNIPNPIGIATVDRGTLLILEALLEIRKEATQWKQIANILSQIHSIKADNFGFTSNGFYGPYHLDNSQSSSWVHFYSECRLRPFFQLSVHSGHLPVEVANQVESVIDRFPQLCDTNVQPSLLHGDAQQNNFVCTKEGTYVIDPAIYFGHPEIDLATIDSWQVVPDTFFSYYTELATIDSGFPQRRNLWLIANYLAAVAAPEGHNYLPKLISALKGYL